MVELQSGAGFAFDVRGDPAEQHDLEGADAPGCAVVPPAPPRPSPPLDPDERDRLRALGYAQ